MPFQTDECLCELDREVEKHVQSPSLPPHISREWRAWNVKRTNGYGRMSLQQYPLVECDRYGHKNNLCYRHIHGTLNGARHRAPTISSKKWLGHSSFCVGVGFFIVLHIAPFHYEQFRFRNEIRYTRIHNLSLFIQCAMRCCSFFRVLLLLTLCSSYGLVSCTTYLFFFVLSSPFFYHQLNSVCHGELCA